MPGKGTVSKWVKKEHHNLAILKKAGNVFEISIDADLAIQLKNGNEVDMEEVLNSKEIFTDVRKGLIASEEKLKEVFGNGDVIEIAKKIIREGEISLTAEYRKKIQEEKKRQIITTINRHAIDPKTKLPHPVVRIEAAMDEANVIIDNYKSADEQIEEIIDKLKPIIPIKIHKEEVNVTIPGNFAAKAFPVAKSFGKVKKQEWRSDGTWNGIIEVPAGLVQDMIDKLNSMTHGGIEIKIK